MIIGHFGLNLALPMPVVKVSLNLPGLTSNLIGIDFLVDTGSTHTCLHPRDARLLVGIDPDAVEAAHPSANRRSARGVGGRAQYIELPAVYVFHHDDGRAQQITREISVARPTTTNGWIPSLLGWDILRFFRIQLDYLDQKVTLR